MPQTNYRSIAPIFFIIICIQFNCFAERNHLGFGFENEKKIVTIPFKSVNNLIILQASIDGDKSINLILDTGIRSLVLFQKSYLPKISEQTFQIKFTGTGVHTPIPALVSTGHDLRLSEDVVANKINAVILKRSNNHLHEIKGIKIHGAFGYQLFARFQVKIDFENNLMTLVEPYKTEEIPGFHSVPLVIHDTKPFVELKAMSDNNEWHQLQMILDLGANHKLLIHDQSETSSIISNNLPKERIAEGLNGSIYGYKTSFQKIRLGAMDYPTTEILIPTIGTYHQESLELKKHGSIGSKFFGNQSIIIDYINARLFIEDKENYIEKPVEYLAEQKEERPIYIQ